MYILDLEGGLFKEGQEGKTIDPRFIACEPMRAWWEGLSHPDVVWHKGLIHLDWEELDRLSAGLVNPFGKTLASYAIFSKTYLHLTLRFLGATQPERVPAVADALLPLGGVLYAWRCALQDQGPDALRRQQGQSQGYAPPH